MLKFTAFTIFLQTYVYVGAKDIINLKLYASRLKGETNVVEPTLSERYTTVYKSG